VKIQPASAAESGATFAATVPPHQQVVQEEVVHATAVASQATYPETVPLTAEVLQETMAAEAAAVASATSADVWAILRETACAQLVETEEDMAVDTNKVVEVADINKVAKVVVAHSASHAVDSDI